MQFIYQPKKVQRRYAKQDKRIREATLARRAKQANELRRVNGLKEV